MLGGQAFVDRVFMVKNSTISPLNDIIYEKGRRPVAILNGSELVAMCCSVVYAVS